MVKNNLIQKCSFLLNSQHSINIVWIKLFLIVSAFLFCLKIFVVSYQYNEKYKKLQYNCTY